MAADTITVLAGTACPKAEAWEVFDPRVLDFFDHFSSALRSSPLAGDTEAASFAFWCRRSRMEELKKRYEGALRVGRGLLFHVPPANVPLLFAYSLAVGMLSGCANLLRMSSRLEERGRLFCALLDQVLSRPEHAGLRARTGLVSYPREEEDRTAAYLMEADGKVVWGGDATVEAMRKFPMKPGAVELVFPDRWSLCLMSEAHVANLSQADLDLLAHRFYNDTYLMDQNACSSPKLVLWRKDLPDGAAARERFWAALERKAAQAYDLTPYKAARKYEALCELAMTQPGLGPVRRAGNLLYRLPLQSDQVDLDQWHLAFGAFLEHEIDALEDMAPFVTQRTQTLTVAGIPPREAAGVIARLALPGVDRVVNVGQAMEFDLTWDGKDLITALSRVINC